MIAHIKAPAKVNLHLEVLNTRTDGYHNICSLMSSIDICDLLKLEKCELHDGFGQPGVEVYITGGVMKEQVHDLAAEENLVYKAVQLYCGQAQLTGNVVISIEKNIPLGGGLGGGSADAAAALQLVNNHAQKYTNSQLAQFATWLGADVPYCLTRGWALCEGIGEIIEPISGSIDLFCLVVNDEIHVNTAEAYRMLNRTENYMPKDLEIKKDIIRKAVTEKNIEIMHSILQNDFELPVFYKNPHLKTIKDDIYSEGAFFVTMTGSGSTIVGLFENEISIEYAFQKLKSKYRHVIKTSFA